MNIGSIGALGGLMAINNLSAQNKAYAVQKPVSDENSNNNITDRVKQNFNAEKTNRFDRIEFNAEQIQNENVEPDEKPDFKAIRLIKSSAIELPEPPDPTEKSAIAERLSELRERFSGNDKIPAESGFSTNNISNESLNNANKLPEEQLNNANNIPKESPDINNNIQATKANSNPELKSTIKFTKQLNDYSSGEFQRIENDIKQSAVVRTSEDIKNDNADGRLTPAQTEGIETYQRIQDYANSLNLSNASIAS